MEDIAEYKKLISMRMIQEDAEAIYSLLQTEKDPIFSMQIIPYYALFVHEFQAYMGNTFVSDSAATQIKDIRNHIKIYTDTFKKSARRIVDINNEHDNTFKSRLRFNLFGNIGMYYNLGTFWTQENFIIGNTQLINDVLNAKDLFQDDAGEKKLELGIQIGSFIASVREGFLGWLDTPVIERGKTSISIDYYCDLNTITKKIFFKPDETIELNLFYLHLLCSLNFVKHIIRPLFANGSTWVFRIEYIVTYHTYRALYRLKNYCDNNNDVKIDKNELDELLRRWENDIFISKFRNCMMHYAIEDESVISFEYLNKPLYGMVETCFKGMDYFAYLNHLRKCSEDIIEYLSTKFVLNNVKLQNLHDS